MLKYILGAVGLLLAFGTLIGGIVIYSKGKKLMKDDSVDLDTASASLKKEIRIFKRFLIVTGAFCILCLVINFVF